MKKFETTNTFVTGVFPDTVADDSTGAATQDGFEYIAANLNNSQLGPLQAIMDYAAGNSNPDVGTVGVPNGVTEAAGASQIIEALHKGFGVGPGVYKPYGKFSDPSVTGDRILLLSNQGVLISSFPELVAACYVGDGNNATAPYFYKSVLADGMTRNVAGPFFILPNSDLSNETIYFKDEKSSGTNGGTFTSGAWQTRTLQTTTGEILGASLAANQFTLPPGTFSIEALAPAFGVDGHIGKLRNITDVADEIIGTSGRVDAAGSSVTDSLIIGTFTIAASKVFEIQHQCSITQASNGFGNGSGFGVVEVYTQVKISKLDSYPWGITY